MKKTHCQHWICLTFKFSFCNYFALTKSNRVSEPKTWFWKPNHLYVPLEDFRCLSNIMFLRFWGIKYHLVDWYSSLWAQLIEEKFTFCTWHQRVRRWIQSAASTWSGIWSLHARTYLSASLIVINLTTLVDGLSSYQFSTIIRNWLR